MLRNSFRGQIFFYFIVVFILFTIAILTFQYNREKNYRIAQLENTLDNITEITYGFIEQNKLVEQNNTSRINELSEIIPQDNIRITLVNKQGMVLYDSFVDDYLLMENHIDRPEIQKALDDLIGSNIRKSTTTKQEYYYYAKRYPDYFVRTAIIYNVEVKNFLKAERAFIFFIASVFTVIGVVLFFVTGRLGEVITKLKDFSIKAGKNEPITSDNPFPDNELGVISNQIIQIYNNLKSTKDDLTIEKDKLFSHLNALNEGIAFFSQEKEITLSNSHFIQNINIISKKAVSSSNKIFNLNEFKELNKFLNKYLKSEVEINSDQLPQIEYIVSKNEKYFKIQSIIFSDKSFEIMINDITRFEKRRILKQQLTSNIAHELKTPLAAISGYLETILDNWPIPEDKQKYFLGKALTQSERLASLVNDVSLLNNIEESGELYEFGTVDLRKMVWEVCESFANKLNEKGIKLSVKVKDGTVVRGNESLLFSIFQNLIENAFKYGGKGIKITINNYHQDDNYYYFSFTNTGTSIPEEHLARIFERFYRIDPGRSREAGGTGLGLSIVKNAIQLHKGEISARNVPSGGIEFLFSLSKY